MKFSRFAAALSLASAASGAQAYDFTGFGIALELQLKATGGLEKYTETSNGEEFRLEFSNGGEQEVIGGVNLNYGIFLAPDFSLLVGATADFGSTDIALLESSLSTPTGSIELNGSLREKDHFSIYVAPGYVVAPETLLYLKFAYHRMTLVSSDNLLELLGGESSEFQRSFDGLGIGIGLQSMIDNNFYVYVDVQRVQYDEQLVFRTRTEDFTTQPASTIAAVGFGYRF